MNTVLRIGLVIVGVVVLVLAGLTVGWALWGRQLWTGWGYGMGPGVGPGVGPGMGPGMMRDWDAPAAPCTAANANWGCEGDWNRYEGTVPSTGTLTIEEAHEAVEQYIDALGYPDLEIVEVMEFEYNFYAIARETDTGIGAMELLVDKWTGQVGPEMGPNMMWNAKYSLHGRGRMMGGANGTKQLAPEEAVEIAQRWLDTNRPGLMVEEHADPFYGYYTIHTLEDGEIGQTGTIHGMLSVHGSTGQVWYHTWHGAFVQMVEEAHGDEGH
ncbi:MAG TPA: hypothetical protein ENN19_17695 [Chloroflexi bacterium]|nr:hypothetical protein [Chloroflexota bacterium]